MFKYCYNNFIWYLKMSIQNIIYNKILSSQQINNSEEIQYLNEDSKKIAQEIIENNNSEGLLYPADLAVHHTVDNAFHYNSLLYIFIIIGLGKIGYDFFIDTMYTYMLICVMSIIAIATLLIERFRLSMWNGSLLMNYVYTNIIKELVYHKRGYESIKKSEKDIISDVNKTINSQPEK